MESKREEIKERKRDREYAHVIGIGVGVGFVDADEDEEAWSDLRHDAPLHLLVMLQREFWSRPPTQESREVRINAYLDAGG